MIDRISSAAAHEFSVVRTERSRCRICGQATRVLLDLGEMPPANALKASRDEPESAFPLVLEHCSCGNFQLRDCLDSQKLYSTYFYATPKSEILESHYARLTDFLERRGYLTPRDFCLEVGSNIGEFLEFLHLHVDRVLGIDPATNICEVACARGIPTLCDFFNTASGQQIRATYGRPDLIVTRHCLAHNSNPHEIVAAASEILAEDGTLVIENAYALNMIESNEFDQVYHEHMFYFTLHGFEEMLGRHGFTIVDMMTSPIHGGSIVVVAERSRPGVRPSRSVAEGLAREAALLTPERIDRFVRESRHNISSLRDLVLDLRAQGKRIYAYGATAKGATLLNAAGLTYQQIPYSADSTPQKQGKFIPQAGIEIISEERAFLDPPDYFLLTAWNYRDELIAKVRSRSLDSVRFIVPVPSVEVV